MKKYVAIGLILFFFTACGGSGGPRPVVDSLPDNTVIVPRDSVPAVKQDTVPDDSSNE